VFCIQKNTKIGGWILDYHVHNFQFQTFHPILEAHGGPHSLGPHAFFYGHEDFKTSRPMQRCPGRTAPKTPRWHVASKCHDQIICVVFVWLVLPLVVVHLANVTWLYSTIPNQEVVQPRKEYHPLHTIPEFRDVFWVSTSSFSSTCDVSRALRPGNHRKSIHQSVEKPIPLITEKQLS